MAPYFIKFSFRVELPSNGAPTYALDLAEKAKEYFLDDNESPPSDLPASLLARFEADEDAQSSLDFIIKDRGAYIWLYAEDFQGDIVIVSLFVQHLLQRFNPAGCVKFAWSADCTSPRSDAYGGGAVFITAQEIREMRTGDWLDEQHA